MKAFACSTTLAAIALASKSQFPKDDAFHADCHVNAQFDGKACADLFTAFDSEMRIWNDPTKSPAGGSYSVKEETAVDYIWATRLTRDKKYTDDILFEFTTNTAGCAVTGHSRSQSMSVYDYSVNFCNQWNVYNGVGGFTYSVGKCGYPADDPVTTCARY